MNNYEGRTRRCLRQPWIASPHIIDYVSQVRRRLRKDGQGKALPCPGALRRDGGRGLRRARRGTPPRRYAAPLPRGEWTRTAHGAGRGRAGLKPAPTCLVVVLQAPAVVPAAVLFRGLSLLL
ncbi:MAG: hypothetical protein LBM98_01105 [Oscillospiraceae bacterium]|nr:hypothetical protein [Oscillospiraceae bacterium]